MKRSKLLPRQIQQTSLDQCRPEPGPSTATARTPTEAAGKSQQASMPPMGSADTTPESTTEAPPACPSSTMQRSAPHHANHCACRGTLWSAVRLVANAAESWAAAVRRWDFSSRRRVCLASVVAFVVFLAFTYGIVHRSVRAVPEQKSPEVAAPAELAPHSEISIETAIDQPSCPGGTTRPEPDQLPRRQKETKAHFRSAACSNAGFARG